LKLERGTWGLLPEREEFATVSVGVEPTVLPERGSTIMGAPRAEELPGIPATVPGFEEESPPVPPVGRRGSSTRQDGEKARARAAITHRNR
jgi:hypothetical protein